MRAVLGLVIVLIVLAVLGVMGLRAFQQKIDSALSAQPETQATKLTPTPTSPRVKRVSETLFVPYWSFTDSTFDESSYQRLVYFGVAASSKGLDTSDAGYQKLPVFAEFAGDQEKILTIRMIDSATNFAILKDTKAQNAVILESVALAKEYGFDEILLNIELSALPFASLVDQITLFNTRFSQAAHTANLNYSITSYGDTFYRVRPFDVEKLAQDVDHLYIMAYDFHKAKGNPGPNFPLLGNDTYGYDYSRMITSFIAAVPLDKLIVVFGMYGYDWTVDENGSAKESGEAISLKEVENSIMDTCQHSSCAWERDAASGETKATYQDSEDDNHVVWFEDEESVKRKQDFLKSKGIGSFAYWAYSYF